MLLFINVQDLNDSVKYIALLEFYKNEGIAHFLKTPYPDTFHSLQSSLICKRTFALTSTV